MVGVRWGQGSDDGSRHERLTGGRIGMLVLGTREKVELWDRAKAVKSNKGLLVIGEKNGWY